MSASEKLKALEFTPDGTAKNPDSMYDLLAALPQIVAVVEAAERLAPQAPVTLGAALSALEEALA